MFFTAIHQMMTESVDLTIVIRKSNGQLTVSTLPKSNGLKDEALNHIVPLTVTGTPQELDAGFLQAVTRPIQKASGLISNMAQFEAQADKAAANSKAAKDMKAKETKEEKEKREKYEKLMKKAEEQIAAKNHKEAVTTLGQAKAHANPAQLKNIEEKIKAETAEMDKGSLFGFMETAPQPQPTTCPSQAAPQQPARNAQPQPGYAGQPPQQAPVQGQRPMAAQQPYGQRPPQQPGMWPPQQPAQQPVQRQEHPQYTGQEPVAQAAQKQYPHRPETSGYTEQDFMQEDVQQQYAQNPEYPTYSPQDYEGYIDFPQSMLEPKYSSYQTV